MEERRLVIPGEESSWTLERYYSEISRGLMCWFQITTLPTMSWTDDDVPALRRTIPEQPWGRYEDLDD